MKEKLLIWFCLRNIGGSGYVYLFLEERPREFSKKMEIEFTFSNGWINKMKKKELD